MFSWSDSAYPELTEHFPCGSADPFLVFVFVLRRAASKRIQWMFETFYLTTRVK